MRKSILGALVLIGLLVVFTSVTFAFGFGNVDGVWGYIDGVTETQDGSSQGADCSRWATGPGDSPTNVSNWNTRIQSGPTIDENQVRYGTGAGISGCRNSGTPSGFDLQSGFGFDGVDSVGTLTAFTPFYMGTFTHYNNPIQVDNLLGYSDLSITITGVTCNDGSAADPSNWTFDYRFNLEETPNQEPCAYPGSTICPDRITLSPGVGYTEYFTCTDGTYTVIILGFIQGDTCATAYDPDALTFDFITEERTDNRACLWGMIINFNPNPVELAWLTAKPQGQTIVIGWETVSDMGILGFNLYRTDADRDDVQQVKLNDTLIASQAPGSPIGFVYSYVDSAARPGQTYYYWLEVVDTSGGTELFGPASAAIPTLIGAPRLRTP